MGRNCFAGALHAVFAGWLRAAPSGFRDAAGFFTGIWHGWIAPVSLVLSLFGDYQIYEANNTGFFYNLGFYMAIISGFGGLALFRRKHKD